jgi:NADH-quinone oxidoreductase subunit L
MFESLGLAPWVVVFPLAGLLINLVLGRRIGEAGVALTACLAAAASFVVSVLLLVGLRAHPGATVITLGTWMSVGTLDVPWALRVDTLSVTMMLVVSGVGTLIHVYAAGYMHFDVRFKGRPAAYSRFFVYLNLFVAAMMVLVSGDNYLVLFVGWEGVGLCSYLLIGFWVDRNPDGSPGSRNAQAAVKAFVTNRIGDLGLILAILLVFTAFGSLGFDEVAAGAAKASPGLLTAITVLMLLAVCGKSAQIPLHVWLPDAMAGPTPVSALIHAATMVTAGVYLVTRSAPLFSATPQGSFAVALVGAVTALYAATIAVRQFDIKKVLAYSTISQLGFMVAAVGLGAYTAGMFHLVTHAFFKALLFLGAGSVIVGLERAHHAAEGHAAGHGPGAPAPDLQDMRSMGGLRRKMPLTFVLYVIGAAALAGIPPLAGFFSKDEILADALAANPMIFAMLAAATFITAFYVTRQVWMVFLGKPRTEAAAAAPESPAVMTLPLVALALLTAAGGAVNLPGVGTLGRWLEHTLGGLVHEGAFDAHVAALSTGLALAGMLVSWLVYRGRTLQATVPGAVAPREGLAARAALAALAARAARGYSAVAGFFAGVVEGQLLQRLLHDHVLERGFGALARITANPIDLGVIDGAANGIARLTGRASVALRRTQTGYVRNYALAVFIGVVFILGALALIR